MDAAQVNENTADTQEEEQAESLLPATKERNLFVFTPREKEVIWPLLKYLEPEWTKGKKEVVLNRPRQVVFETYEGTWEYVDAPELDEETLMKITQLLADRTKQKFDYANPILSTKMPGGHRAQIVAGIQNSLKFSMAIRLHQERQFGLEDYDMSEADRQEVIEAVKNRKTLLIAGGTGSGKTTFMNALLKYLPDDDRVVTLEDVRELKLEIPNWVPLIFSQKTDGSSNINDLLNACLRMRPDRIILGEIRKENAFTFCSAINTGHAGSMATIHANNPKGALDAVINRVMLNGDTAESAINVLKRQLESDIYGVIQLERQKGKVVGYFQILNKDSGSGERIPVSALQTAHFDSDEEF